MLRERFEKLCLNFTGDKSSIDKLWNEIAERYSHPERHYHNLGHLSALLQELDPVGEELNDPEMVSFAVYYHDLVYEPLKHDNEENSAAIAVQRLHALKIPEPRIESCMKMILATKGHLETGDPDINYFTDADLSILGKEWDTYSDYMKKIREEYILVPPQLYQQGRIKMLLDFLRRERIYKTVFFHARYESMARQNLEREIDILSG